MKSKLLFDVPQEKKLRVIIDTDAACEADDPFAIAQALMSPKLMVKGILAEHFATEGSVERSYEEIKTVLNAMDMEADVPVFMGEEGAKPAEYFANSATEKVSPAADFLIQEALRDEVSPLFVLCQGAITNVAVAVKKCPKILDKMTIVWIGTHGLKNFPWREFNAGNDIAAANYILSQAKNLWLIPSGVYSTITVGLAELQQKVYPCGKIGRHLFENMVTYNNSPRAGWTKGESWALGDSPAIAVALNPDCGHYVEHEAPYINEDTSSTFGKGNPIIRIYTDADSRYILEDFFAKLQLNYGS
ncbi:MAG: nucleoside hydrolase [Spirochaetaceae bacterium]|nr:nucleoside hydrolase [Spirochaetaceae bacterium]